MDNPIIQLAAIVLVDCHYQFKWQCSDTVMKMRNGDTVSSGTYMLKTITGFWEEVQPFQDTLEGRQQLDALHEYISKHEYLRDHNYNDWNQSEIEIGGITYNTHREYLMRRITWCLLKGNL